MRYIFADKSKIFPYIVQSLDLLARVRSYLICLVVVVVSKHYDSIITHEGFINLMNMSHQHHGFQSISFRLCFLFLHKLFQ